MVSFGFGGGWEGSTEFSGGRKLGIFVAFGSETGLYSSSGVDSFGVLGFEGMEG